MVQASLNTLGGRREGDILEGINCKGCLYICVMVSVTDIPISLVPYLIQVLPYPCT